jgi:hypothetical protein
VFLAVSLRSFVNLAMLSISPSGNSPGLAVYLAKRTRQPAEVARPIGITPVCSSRDAPHPTDRIVLPTSSMLSRVS